DDALVRRRLRQPDHSRRCNPRIDVLRGRTHGPAQEPGAANDLHDHRQTGGRLQQVASRGFMFAADHAATSLLIKRRFPSVPLTPILVSVQAMELAWVALNYLGVERTTTESTVHSVADIHLAYMPYSHSVATGVGAALLAWLVIEKGLHRPLLGRAV